MQKIAGDAAIGKATSLFGVRSKLSRVNPDEIAFAIERSEHASAAITLATKMLVIAVMKILAIGDDLSERQFTKTQIAKIMILETVVIHAVSSKSDWRLEIQEGTPQR